MPHEIVPISLAMPLGLGAVNCYLIKTGSGFVLIDTGSSRRRAALELALSSAGCTPGTLDLILLTHGDFDHTGNAAYLAEKFGAPVAMHRDDWGMAERGDMFAGRASGGRILRWIARLSTLLFGFGRAERFAPDIALDEGTDLARYGLNAQVLSLLGHSHGSVGILTADGDLFCGDLLANVKGPALNELMDDPAAGRASVDRLKGLNVRTVYPGHGEPFSMSQVD
jgi:hydroxyacylglutathione hydrolase